jgi:hypothetical protein
MSTEYQLIPETPKCHYAKMYSYAGYILSGKNEYILYPIFTNSVLQVFIIKHFHGKMSYSFVCIYTYYNPSPTLKFMENQECIKSVVPEESLHIFSFLSS